MEQKKDLNKELSAEINNIFAGLFKEIGNNRQQLTNKVLATHTALHKELSKAKVDANREKEIRLEVSGIVRMAHQQLPHLKAKAPAAKQKK